MYSRQTIALRSIQPRANALRTIDCTPTVPKFDKKSVLVSSGRVRHRSITSPAAEEFRLEHHPLKNIPYSQGLCTNPRNSHPEDTMVQAVHAGIRAHRDVHNLAIDAASPYPMDHVEYGASGNPEGIGMIEQVGSANGTARFFAFGGVQGKPLVL